MNGEEDVGNYGGDNFQKGKGYKGDIHDERNGYSNSRTKEKEKKFNF